MRPPDLAKFGHHPRYPQFQLSPLQTRINSLQTKRMGTKPIGPKTYRDTKATKADLLPGSNSLHSTAAVPYLWIPNLYKNLIPSGAYYSNSCIHLYINNKET
jgi:hypothetical protein